MASHNNCIHCGRRIVLSPPATERARRYGGRPSDYTRAFTEHSACCVAARAGSFDTRELLRVLDTTPAFAREFTARDIKALSKEATP